MLSKSIKFVFLFLILSGYEFDYVFDWTILKYQQSQRTKPQPRLSVSLLYEVLLFIYFLSLFKRQNVWLIDSQA